MNTVVLVMLICILPALVTVAALGKCRLSKDKPKEVQIFMSALLPLGALELSKTAILRYAPWVYLTNTEDIVALAAISAAPLALITYMIFRISKAEEIYFTEQQHSILPQTALVVTVLILAFIGCRAYEVRAIIQIIDG